MWGRKMLGKPGHGNREKTIGREANKTSEKRTRVEEERERGD